MGMLQERPGEPGGSESEPGEDIMVIRCSWLRALTARRTLLLRRGMLGGVLALIVVSAIHPAHGASLDPSVLPAVQAATFEVVIPKPVLDPLTYEKPLPLDLLPFQFRNDKYFSIGTAFAIGPGRYVTAAHVLDVGIGSLLGAPALRDASGHVHTIDRILKFSLAQDFVVFSLNSPPDVKALPLNTRPALNQVVYAVGNALGTGVVIRDGLYTSDTPEAQDGRWKWMRFSAAASPGNSGGPLLDRDGRIIGIVLMKSPDENLNYALPINRILQAPENVGDIDRRQGYQLDIFDTHQTGTFKARIDLPLSFADFAATYLKLANAFADSQLRALLGKDADKLFPHGEGSSQLLHDRADIDTFPSLVVRGSNGIWGLSSGQRGRTDLGHNGYLERSVVEHQVLFHLRKPDNVTASQLYGDPKTFMDLLLRGSPLERAIGTEKVRITSLGMPSSDSIFTDGYKRRWQVRIWPLPHLNSQLISFSLPVPDGYASIVRLAPAGETAYSETIDLKAMTDFVYLSYGGTLAQWKEYLKQKALLPGAFSRLHIDFDYGKDFHYRSSRLTLSYDPGLQKIEPDSGLTLGFAYFTDAGKVVWDVASAMMKADIHESEVVRVNRRIRPSRDLDDSYQSNWSEMIHRRHPVDGQVFIEDDVSYINRVVATTGASHDGDPAVLYTVLYGATGTHPQAAMAHKLDLLLSGTRVNEH